MKIDEKLLTEMLGENINMDAVKYSPNKLHTYCFICAFEKGLGALPSFCKDFQFITLYLVYQDDLKFKSEYFKFNFGDSDINSKGLVHEKTKHFNENTFNKTSYNEEGYGHLREESRTIELERKVDAKEIAEDKKFLYEVADEWREVVSNERHSDQKLKAVAEEYRSINTKMQEGFNNKVLTEAEKDFQIKLNLWKTKHMHYGGLQIVENIEQSNKFPFELKLNGTVVYFTYRSLIHILSRHYAHLVSIDKHKLEKSYHNPLFQPDEMHLVLKHIFDKLSSFDGFHEKATHNKAYNFQYKGIDYQLYLKPLEKVKLQVSSFYPISTIEEKEKLKGCRLLRIDDELSVFMP